MNAVEGVFLWAAMATYVVTLVTGLIGWVWRKPRAERLAQRAFPVALGLHLGAGLARWAATGHAPIMYAYENSITGSWSLGVIFLVLAMRTPALWRGLVGVVAFVVIMIGLGLNEPQELQPLAPPFRSGWLVIHVTFAWLTFGSYLVSAILAGTYLVTRFRRGPDVETTQAYAVHRTIGAEPGRDPEQPASDAGAPAAALPSETEPPTDPELAAIAARLARMDETCGRLITFGFLADVVMIATGALWAHGLWGRYWQWDPVETWSFVSWLAYGINLHLRLTLGWTGTKACVLAVLSALTVIVTFFGIDVMANVHAQVL